MITAAAVCSCFFIAGYCAGMGVEILAERRHQRRLFVEAETRSARQREWIRHAQQQIRANAAERRRRIANGEIGRSI